MCYTLEMSMSCATQLKFQMSCATRFKCQMSCATHVTRVCLSHLALLLLEVLKEN
eukprot:jgi/Botrbrau1/17421/Bobra.0054s0017.1